MIAYKKAKLLECKIILNFGICKIIGTRTKDLSMFLLFLASGSCWIRAYFALLSPNSPKGKAYLVMGARPFRTKVPPNSHGIGGGSCPS